MRYDYIGEGDRGHLAEVRQIREAHFRQHWIERRICDSEKVKVDDSDAVEETLIQVWGCRGALTVLLDTDPLWR
jgi:hypothetical protein